MDLEDKLIIGTLLVSSGLLTYGIAKLAYHTNNVKKATTKFLDTAASYFSQRTSKPKDLKRLAELAKYRAEHGI